MNLYITTKDKDIKGFNKIKVSENNFDFNSIPKNSCNQIIVEDAVEYFDNIGEFFDACFRLLRKGGSIKIFGLDLRSACQAYVNSQMDTQIFNEIVIKNKRGALSLNELVDFIKHVGLEIERCHLAKGSMYEILAKRN